MIIGPNEATRLNPDRVSVAATVCGGVYPSWFGLRSLRTTTYRTPARARYAASPGTRWPDSIAVSAVSRKACDPGPPYGTRLRSTQGELASGSSGSSIGSPHR